MRLFALLFLFFAGTCAHAQNVSPEGDPPEQQPRQTATVVVSVERDHYEAFISSPNRHERRGYVSRFSNRRNNARFEHFQQVDMRNRYDLRAINALQDTLRARGWELVSTDHTIAAVDQELTSLYEEYFIYTYSIPWTPPPPPPGPRVSLAGLEEHETITTARGQNVDGTMDLELRLSQHPEESRQSVVIYQVQDGRYTLRTRLDDLQLVPITDGMTLADVEIEGLDLRLIYEFRGKRTVETFRQRNATYYRIGPDGRTMTTQTLADFNPTALL